jgi:hypothetical protein
MQWIATLASSAAAVELCARHDVHTDVTPPLELRIAIVALVAAWVAAVTVLASGALRAIPPARLVPVEAAHALAVRHRRRWLGTAALLLVPLLAIPQLGTELAAVAAGCALVPLAFAARAHAALVAFATGEAIALATGHHVVVLCAGRKIWLRAAPHTIAALGLPSARAL